MNTTSLVEWLFCNCDSLQIGINEGGRVFLAVRCDGELNWARTSCSKRSLSKDARFQECFNRLFETPQSTPRLK
jgi:hypothetical protein